MKECAIYYPGFLPYLDWIKASILYYDELSSVFPSAKYLTQLLEETPETTDDPHLRMYYKRVEAIRFLYERELFTPLMADDLLDEGRRKALTREYSRLEKKLTGGVPGAVQPGAVLPAVFDTFSPPYLHRSPQGEAYENVFFDYVHALNRLERPAVEYAVETNDRVDESLWLLTRLVREDVQLKGRRLTPSTCRTDYHDFLFTAPSRPADAVTLVLDNCFPVPQANAGLEELLAFREKYREPLTQVHTLLRTFEYNLATVLQPEGVGELLLELETNLITVLRDISRHLKREGFNLQTATFSMTMAMDLSPNLDAFQVVRQLHGSIVFQAGGSRRRAVRLFKTSVAPAANRKLGQYTLGTVLTI